MSVRSWLSLLNPLSSDGKLMRAIIREAWRRDMTLDEFDDSVTPRELADLAESVTPSPDLTRHGLVPRMALTDKPSTGVPAIETAADAAANGDWKPAADLLAESYGQWDFRSTTVIDLATLAANEDEWLTAWREERPEDKHPEVVDCAALVKLAWQLRGTERAEKTSAEQFAGFHRMLAQAETVAIQAAEALPDDPTPWSTLLIIARGLQYEHSRFNEVWQSLIDRAPHHRRAHQSALQYWCAKWYGSHETMFAFAEQAAALSPSLSILVLHAAFEKADDDPNIWQQPHVRDALNTHLRWLETDGANNIDVRDDLGWAALALVASQRGSEAMPIFKQLGTYAGGLPWSYSRSPVDMFNEYRIKASKASDKDH